MLSFFKTGKNATETQKKICAVYREGACDWSNMSKVVHEVSRWTLLHSPVDQRKLTEMKLRTINVNTTQGIANVLKIFKSIHLLVKMKNVSFILQRKLNRLFGQPNICSFISWHCTSFQSWSCKSIESIIEVKALCLVQRNYSPNPSFLVHYPAFPVEAILWFCSSQLSDSCPSMFLNK